MLQYYQGRTMIKERQAAEYKILEENNFKWMFLEDNYEGYGGYISYRQFISHAIWACIQAKVAKETIEENFKSFKSICEGCTETSEFHNNFIEILYCSFDRKGNNTAGILLLDKTSHKGCYPLHIKNGGRDHGLKNALDDIDSCFEKIFEILEQNMEWSSKTEEDLNKIYNFKKS